MKPNPMTLTHLDNALAILRGIIDPQGPAIDKWLAEHAKGQKQEPDLFGETKNDAN